MNIAAQAYSSGNFEQAKSHWIEITEFENKDSKLEPKKLATVYENLASVEWHLGNPGKAVGYWQESIKIYSIEKDPDPSARLHLAALLIDQSQAYNDLGQSRFSILRLNKAITIIKKQPLLQTPEQASLKPMAFFALGNAYSIQGNYKKAIKAYKKSAKNSLGINTLLAVSIWNNLSQAYQQRALDVRQKAVAAEIDEDPKAISLYQQATRDRLLAIQSARRAVKIGHNHNQSRTLEQAKALIQLSQLASNNQRNQFLLEAKSILLTLPDSIQKVYTLIALNQDFNSQTILAEAVKISEQIGNPRVASFASGAMGKYYEQQQRYEQALFWTKKAQQAARGALSPDSLYQWHWQAGRIYRANGKTQLAIEAYENALADLQSLRSDLAQAGDNLAFDFTADIEPVYRQYLELLLANNPSSGSLERALEARQLLQLSELENFFQDDCLTLESSNISELSSSLKQANTAIVTIIILKQKTYVIWQLDGDIKSYSVPLPKIQLEKLVQQWRFNLENLENDNYLSLSQQLYHLLFTPIKAELDRVNPQALIFVNDRFLRNVPMAALHDGQSFLIEDYAITNSLGLNLKIETDTQILPTQALLFGLTVGINGFSPLPYVFDEIEYISNLIKKEKRFLNREFSYSSFRQEITKNKTSIVHVATHGNFAGTLSDSFLQAYNSQISLMNLEKTLIDHNSNFAKPIQLLVLSACDTAAGNETATLGMSGVAVRTGVRNVLGSLWSIGDRDAAVLVNQFYRHWLQDGSTKEQALRQTQVEFIKNSLNPHPAIWSGFILNQN